MTLPDHDRLRDLCAQRFDDDTDPRLDRDGRTHTPNRKDWQIRKQIESALLGVLDATQPQRSEPVIAVVEVSLDPLSSKFEITLAATTTSVEAEARSLLPAVSASLRAELARRLARKRLPMFRIVLLPAPPLAHGSEAQDA